MISSGMPKSRDDWPPEVLEAAAAFVCGDIVESPPIFYYADPAYGVLARTREYADADYGGPEIIDASTVISAPYGVITTQTCDISEIDFDPPAHPFISVVPVFDAGSLSGPDRSLLRKGKRIGAYYHVPELASHEQGFWVADFRLEVPVEKSWLVGKDPIKGFSEEAARTIPKVLADIRDRPAWAESVSNHLQPALLQELKRLKGEQRALYDAIVSEIDEIGARADSMLSPTWVQLAGFTNEAASLEVVEWWRRVTDVLRERAGEQSLAFHEPLLLNLRECPVATYREFATFPLTRFSPQ